MNHHAALVTVIGEAVALIVLAVLALAVIGAWHACRTVAAWTARTRAANAAAARTQPVRVTPWWANDALPEPQPQPEPDLTDPRCGTDNNLLNQCRDMWRNSPEGEQ